MNQNLNNLNQNNFNQPIDNGIPNNQPLNSNVYNQQPTNFISQSTNFVQPVMQESIPQSNNTLESGNVNNQNFNTKQPKKKNFGLIIGLILVACIAIVLGIVLLNGNKTENTSNDDKKNEIEYSYKYDIYLNGHNINSEVFSSYGYTKNYVQYVNRFTYTTDLELTFVIHESPVRESNIDAEKLLKESFNVKALYNKFSSTEATVEKVIIDDVEYNKYTITYTFDDIEQMDIITIKLGPDVTKYFELYEDSFEIRFMV